MYCVTIYLACLHIFHRNQEDKDGHVKVLIGCKVESFKDSKRNFAMKISQPKEPDMYLSAEDEIPFIEWLTRLQMATKVQTDLDGMEDIDGSTWNMANPRDSMVTNDSGNTSTPGSCRTSIVSITTVKLLILYCKAGVSIHWTGILDWHIFGFCTFCG